MNTEPTCDYDLCQRCGAAYDPQAVVGPTCLCSIEEYIEDMYGGDDEGQIEFLEYFYELLDRRDPLVAG
jgi:hypothetical protein